MMEEVVGVLIWLGDEWKALVGDPHSRGTAYSGRECAGGTVDAAEQEIRPRE